MGSSIAWLSPQLRRTAGLVCYLSVSYDYNFNQKVKQGPFYVFVVCNKCHYGVNVIIFKNGKYSHDFINNINTSISSFDRNFTFVKHAMFLLKRKMYPAKL